MITRDLARLIVEYAVTNRKPACYAKKGDVVLLDISGHCSAASVNCCILLDSSHKEILEKLIETYYDLAEIVEKEHCEHCGLNWELQYQRFVIRTVSESDIFAAEELGMWVDDYLKEVNSI
ncbi:MAG: hypothetical protein QXT58_05070 [Archaeoglobaceae archaeon]